MRNSGGRTVGWWLIGVFLLQAAWIITIPPFRGSDEVDHAYRAAAVARGEWVAGDRADDGRGWLVEVPESLVHAAHDQCQHLPYTEPENCSPAAPAGDGQVLVASSAAGYHPAFYWVIGTAALPFEGASALYAMRIAGALLCLVFLWTAAWAVARLPGRWPMAALTLAISPVFAYSTTVAAPNGLEMAAALSLWASLMAVAHEGRRSPRSLVWIAIVAAVVLGTLRLVGPLFITLIFLTVVALNWRGMRDVIRRHPRTSLAGATLVAASVGSFAWWMFGPLVLEPGETGGEGSSAALTGSNLILWPLQAIAAFPYRDQRGPMIVYLVVIAFLCGLFVLALWRGGRHQKLVLTLSLVASMLLPVLLTLATLEGRGVIWQGRYGIPYGVGFIVIAGYVLGSKSSATRLSWKLTMPTLCLYGVSVAACLVKVRHDELAFNTASAMDASWHAPAPILLAAVVAAAVTCFAVALSGRSREPA